MRHLGVGIFFVSMLVSVVNMGFAQESSNNQGMHDRINALRNRLKNYRLGQNRHKSSSVLLFGIEKNRSEPKVEAVAISFEKLVEDFESRSDVAVTVLFNDSDFAGKQSDKKLLKNIKREINNKEIVLLKEPRIKVDSVNSERLDRQLRYDELRRRVQMATRGKYKGTVYLSSLLAQAR